MKRRSLIAILCLVLIVVSVLLSTTFFFKKASPQKSENFYAKEKEMITCSSNDETCISRNAVALANQLTGDTVTFVKHQCDGPRGCPTPAPTDVKAATLAIQAYAKDSKLQVFPINGVTAGGIMYYCSKEDRCWSVNAKTNKVISEVK